MTDMIPADKVRDIIARHRDGASHRGGMILDDLKALLPRPTLADMTDEERRACQWMQADVRGHSVRHVIANAHDRAHVRLFSPDGESDWMYPDLVTPRPDLPRLEWPGTEKPVPAPALPEGWRLADHQKYGRVIVTTENPDEDGLMAFVYRADCLDRGQGHNWCKLDALTFLDTGQESDTYDAVPPNTLAVGSEWDDIDALTTACETSGRNQVVVADCDGDVSVWEADAGWWEAGLPSDGYEPFTILHAGKGGDQ